MARRSTIGENPLDAVIPPAPPASKSKPAGELAPRNATEAAPPPPTSTAIEEGRLRERVTLHLSRDLIDRMRNVAYWTPGLTLADLAEEALTRHLVVLEEERGEPFPTRRAELKRGRPIR